MIKNYFKFCFCFFFVLFHGFLSAQGTNIPLGCSNSGPEINASPKADLRGTYLTSVYNLDWPSNRTATPAVQQTELITILDKLVVTGINTVYFQVRPECDALYNSSIEPWSYWLTGTQGKAPNPIWDPLSFAIVECKKRGLDLHAWLNPYRASVGGYTLASNHVSKLNPSWVFTASNNSNLKVLNPGLPAVKNYIISIVQDLANRYDIDGVVFDDYFYPDQGMANNQDATTYANNNPTGISNIDDWRRDNVNKMIAGVYDALQVINANSNKNVVFGVAPFGIWKNGVPTGIVGNPSFSALYCDPINWLQNGKVDYISPQLYWKIGGSQDYIKLSQWWNDQAATAGRHLYVSQGYDRLPSTSSQNWPASEIQNQIIHNRTASMTNTFGQTSYSTQYIMSDEKGIATALQTAQYKFKSIPPSMPWKDNVCPLAPSNIRFEGTTLKWDAPLAASDGDLAVKYVVYAFATQADVATLKQDGSKVIDIVNATQLSLTAAQLAAPNNFFLVTALDKNNNESPNVIGYSSAIVAIVPVPTSPTSGQLYVNSPVNFTWDSTIATADYRIQVSKSSTAWTDTNGFTSTSTPNSTVVVNGIVNTTKSFLWDQASASVSEPAVGGTTYYYTIRSFSAATGTSKYSAPVAFTPKSANCTLPGATVITVDNSAATLLGTWIASTSTAGYVGANYVYDNNELKGSKTATFIPTIAQRGKYEVFINHTAGTNRPTNVPVDVVHENGTTTTIVNQQINNGTWVSLGKYDLSAGTTHKVVIRTTGTTGVVIADAVRFNFIDCLPETAAPIADFTPASATVCVGQTVSFVANAPGATSYSWTFVGGTPSTSTLANPVVTYNAAGSYEVSLTASNATGSNVKTIANAINVNATTALALTSNAGTNAQTLCLNTSLSPITYAVTGTATGATVTGLPAGVTGSYSSGVVTISGTSSATGTFNYTVSTIGGCSVASATGTIVLKPAGSISLTSVAATANQTLCATTTLANVIYAIAGSATGATVTGLPAGVTGTYASGVFTLSGAPTVVGTFNYTVTATGGCTSPSLTGAITVNAAVAITAGFTAPLTELAIGENMTLTNTSTGATTYNWTFPNGVPATSTAANPTVNFSTTGSKVITLVATNACGSSTTTLTVCVGTSTKTTLETFEANAGRFTSAPTTSGSTVGVATTSTLARATDSFKTGTGSLKAVLADNTASTSNWTVRLLSGGGTPASNQAFVGNQGSFGFWLKTSTANAGAMVTAWIDDVDGLEELPPLAIINNGAWNYYQWFLPTAVGATITTGNGIVGGASVTLDAIVIKQNNTATTMTVWIDDVAHTYISGCSGTRKMLDIEPIKDEEMVSELRVYPNPTQGVVTLSLDNNTQSDVRVYNMLGQELIRKSFEGTEQQLDLSSFPNGLYLLQVTTEGKTTSKKIVLQK